ncbi:MAG: hypothetical protein A2Y28_05045 [Chlamydiae bacterium GWC2_50_10]|nr:MAG: hypothetical protein A2Z85_02220 [Chlamydiae bacterium GWA2_50_15]OGN54241.1 MAG: hypothetical protein A2098_03330 [Chlamydiae bacterium GWF2_49_8]OGN54326.1 MAG: hypothetical protein A2Y28_05045 [Chlamydiae bacterium GWC2_50_10]OGN58046.1 MAG: hypothetical protein A3D18_02955 [Chlamydiae bacterium RIFCSPHIGHO2_02_FULL_49_29]OGN62960.1 MAG: hypothetical protein A3E26_02160 [Chlamydiae bacterium RIFCSPHIGHO2_12_FULL_49_32]OGN75251.1 MAG: hypothetical protein A3G30_05460 [Chlamydiae bact
MTKIISLSYLKGYYVSLTKPSAHKEAERKTKCYEKYREYSMNKKRWLHLLVALFALNLTSVVAADYKDAETEEVEESATETPADDSADVQEDEGAASTQEDQDADDDSSQ